MKSKHGLAYLTADEMRRIDELAISTYGIEVAALMENAGSVTSELAKRVLGGKVAGRRICCLIGKGNNGGDGLVAARHLHNWGAQVTVVVGTAEELGPVPMKQFETVRRMGVPVRDGGLGREKYDLIVDALLGYNSKGNPRKPLAAVIRQANGSGFPILAVDIPSGLDATTGEPNAPCIEAAATITLGFPKTGFLNEASRKYTGELFLGDISIPRRLYEGHSTRTILFGAGPIVEIGRR
jgi:hydroxyethylthiazole kinase-like uncharacterized protein yjeF